MNLKHNFIMEFENKLKDMWNSIEEVSFKFMVSESVLLEEINLTDIHFGTKSDCDQIIFCFKIKDLKIKIDYLFDFNNLLNAQFELLPHNLYSISDNPFDCGDIFLKDEDNPNTKIIHLFTKLLNELEMYKFIQFKKNEIYKIMEIDESQSDALFHEKYKDFLTGVIKVKGTRRNNITVLLESGLSFEANKNELETNIYNLLKNKV